jgi:uncharacterized protein YndB with AHSA1/START domain
MTAPDDITPQMLRLERLLDAPLEKVWQYLVDPNLRARWFMGGPTELRPGGAIGMTMNHDALSDDAIPTPERYRPYIGKSWNERIVRIEPPHVLVFTWEDGKAGEVTFELSAVAQQTRLVLTHRGLRGPEDALNFGGGWMAHLEALQGRMTNRGVPNFWALHDQAEMTVRAALEVRST